MLLIIMLQINVDLVFSTVAQYDKIIIFNRDGFSSQVKSRGVQDASVSDTACQESLVTGA